MTLTKVDTPMKAIRTKCLDCCCGSSHEVKLCVCSDCSLYPYRFGHRPNNVSGEEIFDENDALPEDEDSEGDDGTDYKHCL